MPETIKLDPSAVASSRTEVDITEFITDEGVNWDVAGIEAYYAQGRIGSDPVDFSIPNRQVSMPLRLMTRGTVTFDTIRRQLQSKVGLFQREGGWLSRVTSAGTLYADVVNASLRLGGDWLQASKSVDIGAELMLELKPDWYGAEVTLDDQTETTETTFTKLLQLSSSDAVISGDYPGRVRVLVDEDDADTQHGLLWGFRSRYYDSANTAALHYRAGSLTPLDTAGTVALTGAIGGTAVRHNSLLTDWTPVLSTTLLAGTAAMTHQGSYRVWARCHSTSATPPRVRFLWDVGDLTYPTVNTSVEMPDKDQFYFMDLGEVRLDPSPVGTHRWQGQVQALGAANGDNIYIDVLDFQPLDDGAGRLTAAELPSVSLTSFVGRDEFTSTTAGNALNGRTATAGGTWATSGAATDFVFADASGDFDEHITRGSSGTRFAVLGSTNYTDTAVSAVVTPTEFSASLLARWTDSSNYVRAGFQDLVGESIVISVVVGGTGVVFFAGQDGLFDSTRRYRLTLSVFASGRILLTAVDVETGLEVDRIETAHSSLATGGTLASGEPGLIHTGSATVARFDDFRAWVPTADAVLFPSQSAQITTDGIVREESTGTAYGPVSGRIGGLPRIPPSGLESRKVELYLKGSRGNFSTLPDSGIDDISAQVFYRPCWLIAPGS